MVIHRRTGWTAHIALRPGLAVLSCFVLILTGCSNQAGLKAGDAATFADGSSGEISTDGQTWAPAGDGSVVPAGAQVRAAEDEVRLTLRDGTARLAPGTTVTVNADRIDLDRGDLLVAGEGGLSAALGDTVVEPAGTVRLTSGLAARVAVYAGAADVQRPAQEREIPVLRELDLSDFRLAARPVPMRYDEDNAWDQELLADAIAFDGEVARLARGIDIEFGTRPQRPGFYREFTGPRVVPVLATAATEQHGRAFGPPSDVLMTMFVAQAVGESGLVDTIRRVAGLRSAGARWGLIAVEFDIASETLVAEVDALDSSRLALAERTPAQVSDDGFVTFAPAAGRPSGPATGTGEPPIDSGPGGGSSSTGGDDPGDDPGGGGESPGGGGGDDPEDPGPTEEPEPGVDEVVSDVVDTVESEDPPSEEPDTTGGLPAVLTLPDKLPVKLPVKLPLP